MSEPIRPSNAPRGPDAGPAARPGAAGSRGEESLQDLAASMEREASANSRVEADALVELVEGSPLREDPPTGSGVEGGVATSTGPQVDGGASPRIEGVNTAGPGPAGRRASREADGAWLGGVSTGLAHHLRWPVMALRLGFVALAATQFIGVVIYGVLWLLLPRAGTEQAPGLDAAEHAGLRTSRNRRISTGDIGAASALLLVGGGLAWLLSSVGWGLPASLYWPIAIGCGGLALVWWQADQADQGELRRRAGGRGWLAPFVARAGWLAAIRVLAGLGLVGGAVGLIVASQSEMAELPRIALLLTLAVVALALLVAPFFARTQRALNEAREAKLLADARADMAAHLHDSVLQTLALIQRQAADPKAVAALARRQERELRTWLYGDPGIGDATTLKAALAAAAAEIEDDRGVPVELVCVGDAPLDPALDAMVKAAREAILNAAKHSGAAKIDVYAEADPDFAEVFVRDRGVGFDLDAIPSDRMGVKGSIMDRMSRHGGTARVRSEPGEGTEVRLEMSR